jgi:secondary thiamine-phosphate synthase enzyme
MLTQSMPMQVCRFDLRYLARQSPEFIDITADVEAAMKVSGITNGMVAVTSMHTTAAITVQENEPLLLQDLCDMLERLAPHDVYYRHDDFDIRVVNMHPDEPRNGHAHCRQSLLGRSETLIVNDGQLALGRWGRIFFVELDAPREREVQVQVIGV